MANDIKLKKILAEAKASADLQFPLRELINTGISSEIGSATGGTVDVKIRNVGQTLLMCQYLIEGDSFNL